MTDFDFLLIAACGFVFGYFLDEIIADIRRILNLGKHD